MRSSVKIALWLAAGLTPLLLAGIYRYTSFRAAHPSLAAFNTTRSQDWSPYGGSWKIFQEGMQNDSEERGAKLMNGSLDWSNYVVEADIQLLGPYGDAGLLIRSSGEEEGVDAYHGYYAFIRNMNDTLTLGRADYGLDQFVIEPISSGVGPQEWFHLRFIAYDCDIAAVATSSSGAATYTAAHDPRCIRKGRFGLRSFSTSARWKNIRVSQATHQDIEDVARHIPIENITYSADSVRNVNHAGEADRYMDPIRREAKKLRSSLNSESIESLALINPDGQKNTTVHGVVTLVSPELYIQDGTGSIRAPNANFSGPVKAGDQVEAQGEVVSHDFHPMLEHATIRVLSSNVPIPALAVTAFELAVGNHEGHLVEVEAELRDSFSTGDNRLVLQLAEGSQEFYAIADQAELPFRNKKLENGSRLRLRGVETLDTRYTNDRVSFAILLSGANSVSVIEDPPWWNRRHIAMLALGILVGILTLFVLSHRLQQWRIESVLDERERLALEMHDTLAQSFAGIGFQLQAIRQETKAQVNAEKQVDIALSMVRSSHEEAKKSIAALRPRFLNNADLIDALRQAAERLVEGEPVRVIAHAEGPIDKIPLRVSDALFRIGQEAISNAVRHSGAKSITISLSLFANMVRLSIKDDGRGFDAQHHSAGFGIRGMSRRSDNIGAKIQIASVPGTGTTVTVTADLAPRRSSYERLRSAATFILGE